MSEKLIIENFAGISHLEVEVKPITIFIGEQTTGKSVVAKLIYFFKDFFQEFILSAYRKQSKKDFDNQLLQKFNRYFPENYWRQNSFKIQYLFSQDIELALTYNPNNKNKLKVTYSPVLNTTKRKLNEWWLSEGKVFLKDFSPLTSDLAMIKTGLRWLEKFLEAEIGAKVNAEIPTQIFIPAGRSFFATLQQNLFLFLQNNNTLDPFLIAFGRVYLLFKNLPRNWESTAPPEHKNLLQKIDQIIKAILKGQPIYHKEQDFIKHQDGRQVDLTYASSGQQELYPLYYVFKSIPLLASNGSQDTSYQIYFEEPEAHLFPTAQKQMVELIATLYNLSPVPVHFVITTHSPYILTSFNNLIEAHTVSQKLPENEHNQLEKIVPQEQWLNFDHVQAYALSGGTGQSIMDEEYRLITADLIDSVSENIAVQFDQLLDLKYEEKEEKSE